MDLTLPRNFTKENDSLCYKGHSLLDIIAEHGPRLRLNDTDSLIENQHFIKTVAQEVFSRNDFSADYLNGYAIKANQHSSLVSAAASNADFLEVSSYNDLLIIEKISHLLKDKMVICHGFKLPNSKYYEKIIELQDSANIVVVIDSIEELQAFFALDKSPKLGIRIATTSEEGRRDRFGITADDVISHIDLLKEKSDKLVMLHMQVGGTVTNTTEHMGDLAPLYTLLQEFKKHDIRITYLNIGGGLPSRAFTGDSFYTDFFESLINKSSLKELNSIPTILTESGRFLASETEHILIDVLLVKQMNANALYILNGSSINLVPEIHLDEKYGQVILPVNLHKNNSAEVICTGTTCDPEDFFSHKPVRLPLINEGEKLFLLLPCTGAYQQSISGASRNMPGHCLIENMKEVTFSNEGKISEQKAEFDFLKSLGY